MPKARRLFDIGQPLECKPTAYRKDVRSSPGEISATYGWLRFLTPKRDVAGWLPTAYLKHLLDLVSSSS